MRITGGSLNGRKVKLPFCGHEIRPTQDRVREALFSSVASVIPDCNVIDLFAGTGALGFEAISRGSKCVFFVEHTRKYCQCIGQQLIEFGVYQPQSEESPDIQIICSDVYKFINEYRGNTKFDLVLADPPYDRSGETLQKLLFNLQNSAMFKYNTLLIVEQATQTAYDETDFWHCFKNKKYGETSLLFFKKVK
jgi:16S rRNA (guanine966-N2)-methyltransferase